MKSSRIGFGSISNTIILGRPPRVRQTIVDLLGQSRVPLAFSEVNEQAARKLGGKSLDGKTVTQALDRLRELELVEIVIEEGKRKYGLKRKFDLKALEDAVSRIVT